MQLATFVGPVGLRQPDSPENWLSILKRLNRNLERAT
jgi:hypothetical protein